MLDRPTNKQNVSREIGGKCYVMQGNVNTLVSDNVTMV